MAARVYRSCRTLFICLDFQIALGFDEFKHSANLALVRRRCQRNGPQQVSLLWSQILDRGEFAVVQSRTDLTQILQFAQQEQWLVGAGIKARMRAETYDPMPLLRRDRRGRVSVGGDRGERNVFWRLMIRSLAR